MNKSNCKLIVWLNNENDVKWLKLKIHELYFKKSLIKVVLASLPAILEYEKQFNPSPFSRLKPSEFSVSFQDNEDLLQCSKNILYDFIFHKCNEVKNFHLLNYQDCNLLEIQYEKLCNSLYRVMYAIKVYHNILEKYPHANIIVAPIDKPNNANDISLNEYIRNVINYKNLCLNKKKCCTEIYFSNAPTFPVFKKEVSHLVNPSKLTIGILAIGTRHYSMQLRPFIKTLTDSDCQILYLSPYIRNKIFLDNEIKGLNLIPLNICWFVDNDINQTINIYFEKAKLAFKELLTKVTIYNLFKSDDTDTITYFFKKQLQSIFTEIFKSLYYLNCAKNFFSHVKTDLLFFHTGALELSITARQFGVKMIRFPHGMSAYGFDISTAIMGSHVSYGPFKLNNLKKCGIYPDRDLLVKSYLHHMDKILFSYINNYKQKKFDYRRPSCIICDNINLEVCYKYMSYGVSDEFINTIIKLSKDNPSLQIIIRLHHGPNGEDYYHHLKYLEGYGIFIQIPSPNNCLVDFLANIDFVIMTGLSSSVIETLIRGRPVIYYTKYLNFLTESDGYPNSAVHFAETETELFEAVKKLMNKQIDSNVVQYHASKLIDGYTTQEKKPITQRLKRIIANRKNIGTTFHNACLQHTQEYTNTINRTAGTLNFRKFKNDNYDEICNPVLVSNETYKRIVSLKFFTNIITVLNYKDKNSFVPFTAELVNDFFYKVFFLQYDFKLDIKSADELYTDKGLAFQALSHFLYICNFLKNNHYLLEAHPSDITSDKESYKICAPEKLFTEVSLKDIYGINTKEALHLLKMHFDKNYVLPILINYYCKEDNFNFFMRNRSIFLSTNIIKQHIRESAIIHNDYRKWLILSDNVLPNNINSKHLNSIEKYLLSYKI